jgi:hypothetical protein
MRFTQWPADAAAEFAARYRAAIVQPISCFVP